MSNEAPTISLRGSHKMPMVVFGTGNMKPGDVDQALTVAIDVGYRHFDCAWLYQNEKEVGETLQQLYKKGKIRREDLFLTGKLWPTFAHPDDVREGFEESLKNLQTDYLDLYLIHLPTAMPKGKGIYPKNEKGEFVFNNDVNYVDTWKELEKLRKEGLVRNIGVSNFNEQQITNVIEKCSIPPSVHQIESHPFLTLDDHVKFCKDKGMVMVAYASLGSGDRLWATADDPVVLEDSTLKSIAEKHGKTPAQIAIRFQIQRGVAAISKSIKPERIRSNFKVFDFELTPDEMKSVNALNKNWKGYEMEWALSNSKFWAHRPNYAET